MQFSTTRRVAGLALSVALVAVPATVMTNASASVGASAPTRVHSSTRIHVHHRVGRYSLPTQINCVYKKRKLTSFSWKTAKVSMNKHWAAKHYPYQYVILYLRFYGKVHGKWKPGPYVPYRLKAPRGSGHPPLVSFVHSHALHAGGKFKGKVTAQRLGVQVAWYRPDLDRGNVRDGWVTDNIVRYRDNVRGGIHKNCPEEFYDPSWTRLAPTQGPPSATNTSAVYDTAANEMVLFGGRDTTGASRNVTWTWNGTAWTQVHSALSPSPRQDAAMAYDAANSTVVMFGGFDDTATDLGDTWTWSVEGWKSVATTTAPTPRDASGQIGYDEQTNQVVLFGGVGSDGTLLDDTWTWDGTTWTLRNPSKRPPAGAYGSMAYDEARKQLILVDDGQTWAWSGTNWSQLHPAHHPSSRAGASMAYDPRSSRIILFGGNAKHILGDMWSWNGSDWTKLVPQHAPKPRESAALVYSGGIAPELFLYGGDNGHAYTDMWTWAH